MVTGVFAKTASRLGSSGTISRNTEFHPSSSSMVCALLRSAEAAEGNERTANKRNIAVTIGAIGFGFTTGFLLVMASVDLK